MRPDNRVHVPAPARGECSSNKIQFANRKQAKAAARRLPGHAMGTYRCPECDWFHIGHRPQRVRNGEISKTDWINATTKTTGTDA